MVFYAYIIGDIVVLNSNSKGVSRVIIFCLSYVVLNFANLLFEIIEGRYNAFLLHV